MTQFIEKPNANGLVKLTGCISSYRCQRAKASFIFGKSDRNKMGAIAVAASLAGTGGQAMSTASSASDVEEEADYIEFTVGKKEVRGWVWRSPFKNGDEVEIAAKKNSTGYELFAVARPIDRTIALYPHCSRGRVRHYANATKWWLIITFIHVAGVNLLAINDGGLSQIFTLEAFFTGTGFLLFFAAMVFSLTRKWLPFVRVAENVFRTLGWANPGTVDLKKTTKTRRNPGDPGEYGAFYFYY